MPTPAKEIITEQVGELTVELLPETEYKRTEEGVLILKDGKPQKLITRDVYWTNERLEETTPKEYVTRELINSLTTYKANKLRIGLIQGVLKFINDSMPNNAKPHKCPVCKQTELIKIELDGDRYKIYCSNPAHASLQMQLQGVGNEEEAIKNWNIVM